MTAAHCDNRFAAESMSAFDASNRCGRADELEPRARSGRGVPAAGLANLADERLVQCRGYETGGLEDPGQVDSVVDDARKINQVVARGNYGADAARLWAALRAGLNDLARAYGVQPLGA